MCHIQEPPVTSIGTTAKVISSSMAVLNEHSDDMYIPTYTDYIDDYNDGSMTQEEQPPSLEQEVLDSVPAKKQKLQITSRPSADQIPDLRLPQPCPLPNTFSVETLEDEKKGQLVGCNKYRMLREACSFYRGICPNPTPSEYTIMAQTLCERFPQIKDKLPQDGIPWVSYVNVCLGFNKIFTNLM